VASEDRLRELEEKYEDYKVYDNQGERIGKVDDLFVDEADREEYIGVKMGFFGLKSTLIPMEIVRVNENDRSVEVSESRDRVKSAPSFDDDEDITPNYEDRIRSYFGLESLGTYGAHADRESRDTADHEDPGERTPSTADDSIPEYRGASESEETSEGGAFIGGTGSSEEAPTTRQTEETETFQEGGRTKIRRRSIREEIIEEDDPNARD
jgi:sporulation protein YlmC with PRC-barrel domain